MAEIVAVMQRQLSAEGGILEDSLAKSKPIKELETKVSTSVQLDFSPR
jgi:hypothetical protein